MHHLFIYLFILPCSGSKLPSCSLDVTVKLLLLIYLCRTWGERDKKNDLTLNRLK